jgi:small GTP-binding protein
MAESKPIILRSLAVGDAHVGKSSLLLKYTNNEYHNEYMPTIGIDFRLKTVTINNKICKLQLWDTAGQDRFRTITNTYYRGAHGVIVVYDVTSRTTFNNIPKYIDDIKLHGQTNVKFIIVGNKCDNDTREVSTDEGQALANKYNVPFFECSAKTGYNIDNLFDTLANNMLEYQIDQSNNKPNNKLIHKQNYKQTYTIPTNLFCYLAGFLTCYMILKKQNQN